MNHTRTSVLTMQNRDFFLVAQEFLGQGKHVRFLLKGNSMLPFLRQGDLVCLHAATAGDLRLGEVVLVNWKGSFILHRLVFATARYLYLAGDNNLFRIEKVQRDCVIARVIWAQRAVRPLAYLGGWGRFLGLLWFASRPIRWIINVLTKKLQNHEIEK
jgi:signal peptidase